MRRIWGGLALAGLMVASAAVGWASNSARRQIEVEYKQIQVAVDGKVVASDDEPFLYVEKGRVFVPARPLAEALGAKVGWDQATSTVQVHSRGHVTVERQGDSNVWSMPAQGFSLKAPAGFMRQEMSLFLFQLSRTDASGTVHIGVHRMPTGSDSLMAEVESLSASLSFFLQDVAVKEMKPAEGRLTLKGSAKLSGNDVEFAVHRIESKGGNWLLVSLVPSAKAAELNATVEAIFASFTEH